MRELWLPGVEGPHEEFVARLHRQIERFASSRGIEQASVEIELRDGSRFTVDSLSPEPGYGFVTIVPHAEDEVPEELVVPINAIARVELYRTDEPEPRFGFSIAPA